MSAKKITGTAGTTQTITGSGVLLGFSIRESAGTPAAASVRVYDNTSGSATADLIATVDLAASSSRTFVFRKPLKFKLGLRTVITGQVDGSLIVS